MADRHDFRLKEYESLRAESIATFGNRLQVFAFGLAAIGALYGGLLTLADPIQKWLLVVAITCGAIPAASISVMFAWFGELERMTRVGNYIAGQIEKVVNDDFKPGDDPDAHTLYWETWLRSNRLVYPYAAALIFGAAAVAGPLMGTYLIIDSGKTFCDKWRIAATASEVGSLACGLYLIGRMRRALKASRDVLDRPANPLGEMDQEPSARRRASGGSNGLK